MEVKPGYRQTEVGVIPEDWEVKPMGELFTFQNGVNADKSAYGSGVPFINVLEVITHSTITEARIPGRIALTAQAINAFAVHRGDVLFNRTSETQEEVGLASVYIGTEAVVFGGFVIRARPQDSRMNSSFTAYALRSPIIRSQIVARGQGAVRANIGQQDLSRVQVVLPTKAEQEAIAEALSNADALIESLEQLLAKKRHLQQSAMQELLTGKKRLPGFNGEWQVKRLGSVLKFQVGFPFSSAFFNEEGQGIRLVKNRDLKSDDQVYCYSGNFGQEFLVRDGDVLVGMDGDFLPCLWAKGPALLNQRVGRIVPLSGLDRVFAFYYLVEPLKGIENATSSTTVKHLSHGDIEGIEKALPIVEEQTAIAATLFDVDAEIVALEAKLTKARSIKLGMMQELLTGRVRLS
jgi:type I restriction enzyme S subunit